MTMAYQALDLHSGRAYISKECSRALRRVRGIIFDCDGVLIDSRASYNRAIGATVSYVMEKIARSPVPSYFLSHDIIFALRRTGLFNNDWDTSFVLLLYLFSRIPKGLMRSFSEAYRNATKYRNPINKLWAIGRESLRWRQVNGSIYPEDSAELESLISRLSSVGEARVRIAEGLLREDLGWLRDFESLLAYPGKVGESLLTTVFQEFFLGSRAFEQEYGEASRLRIQRGLLMDEKVVVTKRSLESLEAMLGPKSLGVASGRRMKTFAQTMGGLISFFNKEAMVFLEDVQVCNDWKADEMEKPNPYSLLKAARGLTGDGTMVYVGDSAEDVLMAQRANGVEPRFVFAGVCGQGSISTITLLMFQDMNSHMIINSVNDLPAIIRMAQGERW